MRIRQHVNPLRSDYLAIDLERLRLPAGRPIEVELGSAEAYYLMERAAEEPERSYVGIELRRDMVAMANAESKKRGLSQVLSVFANISTDLPRLFAPASVNRFVINFPDPWFKYRQRKRRVVSEELVDQLATLLAPGGEVLVATDIFDIALDAMAALEREHPRFSNLRAPWSFLPKSWFSARSWRERHCEEAQIKIWRMAYRIGG